MPIASELNITSANALDLANAIFGRGITVNSATLSGDAVQSGIYSGGLTTSPGVAPSDSGVILSTGNVADFTNSSGTTDTNVNADTSTDVVNGVDGDADLNGIAGQATFDGIILEATFTPTGDYITMQFVFSSEEYLEFVNGGVNDSVGVWVNGVFTPMTPTGQTVSIDTVNTSTNENLYVDNPATTDPYNTEMDGLTVTMSLKAPVNAGVANTIKIGLADGGDAAYDSNVLIAGDSIQTVALAFDDQVSMAPGTTRIVDVLANDLDADGSGLTITEINGQTVSVGQTVTLATGEQITLNADQTLSVTSTGTLGSNALTYKVETGNGESDIGYLTVDTVNTPPLDGYVQGDGGDNSIGVGYLGDPDGDRVDNSDEILPGAGPQDDVILAYGGNDSVFAGLGDDSVEGGTGNDTLFGESGSDTLLGGDGADSVDGDGGDDSLRGGDGNDVLIGDAGNDTGWGDAGDDQIYDASGANLFYGGTGNDSIYGGIDSDTASGEVGNDLLVGNAGNDQLYGGTGTDSFDGGDGADLILGDGQWLDTDDYLSGPGTTATNLTIDNQSDGAIELWWIESDGTLTFYQTVAAGSSHVQPTFEDHNWVLRDEDGYHLQIIEGAANQTVTYGPDLGDSITGGTGNDTIYGQFGDDTIATGDGDDSVLGGSGNDTLYGDAGADVLEGGDDADLFYGGAGDVIDGGEGGVDNDTLDLTGSALPDGSLNVSYDANPENGTVVYRDASGTVVDSITFSNIENVVACFTPGTLIKTVRGEVDVARLRIGDRVLTRDCGYKPIRWIGSRKLDATDMAANPALRPVRIARGALGGGFPERDMIVSPQHRVLIASVEAQLWFGEEEVLVPAVHLTCLDGVERMRACAVEYIHFMFDQHEVVLGDGVWSESFLPGDRSLAGLDDAARTELLTLFPELAGAEGQADYVAARPTLKAYQALVLLGA